MAAMLCFEASLARAEATVGLIPEAAAQSIVGTCKVELFDVAKIVRESGRAGNIAIPLIKTLNETVGIFNRDAASVVHFGSSSQDVIDTAMALVTRDALRLIDADVHKVVTALISLATSHADAPVLARTLMQPASVTSFSLKCAVWAAPLLRGLQPLQVTAHNALAVHVSGPVGTLAQMQASGKHLGPKVVSPDGDRPWSASARFCLAHATRRVGSAGVRVGPAARQPRKNYWGHFADWLIRSWRTGGACRVRLRRLFGHAAQAQHDGLHGGARGRAAGTTAGGCAAGHPAAGARAGAG